MKFTPNIEAIARQIISAIVHGAHTLDMIRRNMRYDYTFRTLCDVIGLLERDGIIEYSNNNLAGEYGYFITDAGWDQIG